MMFGIGGSLNKVNKGGTLYSNLQYVLCGYAYFTSLYQRQNYFFFFVYGQMQRPAFSLFQFTETRNKIVTVTLTAFTHIAFVSGKNIQRAKI
jgi:hypothetical protein